MIPRSSNAVGNRYVSNTILELTERSATTRSAARILMRDGVAATEAPAGTRVLELGALAEVIQAVARALAARRPEAARPRGPASDKPLLDLEETAELLGVSRMTVARMADEGRLPSVVVRRGRVQKNSPDPRAFVDKMVAAAAAGAQVDLEEYAAAWLAKQLPAIPAHARDQRRRA